MVAGEEAQAAGVDGEAFVEAELGGEVGDLDVGFLEVLGEPAWAMEVIVQLGFDPVKVGKEAIVFGEFVEPSLRDQAAQADGAVIDLVPQLRIDAGEERNRFGVPAPPKVVCDSAQGLQAWWQRRGDSEGLDAGLGHDGLSGFAWG